MDIQAVSAVAAAFGRSILRLLLSLFGTDGWHNHVASSCASGLLWSSPLVTGERAQWTTQRRRVMHIVECITPIATVLDSVMHHAVFFKWYANARRPWIHWLLQMNHSFGLATHGLEVLEPPSIISFAVLGATRALEDELS